MLGKTSKPMIKILIGSIRQHIESKNQSPRGLKDFDLGRGVGLGIVAALDNCSRDGPTKIPENKALLSRSLSRSKPIPANPSRVCEEMDSMDSFEKYSVVTCHGPKGSYSKVYYPNVRKSHHDKKSIRVECSSSSSRVFHISPAKEAFDFSGIRRTSDDFLSSCNMCRKKLHGKDIYMYRGEKAFCSTECRSKQIVLDDRKEKYCSREASRRSHVASTAADVSSSPYTNTEQIFAGILAS